MTKCPQCKRPVKYYVGNKEVPASRMEGTDRLCSECYEKGMTTFGAGYPPKYSST